MNIFLVRSCLLFKAEMPDIWAYQNNEYHDYKNYKKANLENQARGKNIPQHEMALENINT